MRKSALDRYAATLEEIRAAGTWKGERVITTHQLGHIDTTAAKNVINMCANNYLGLSGDPILIQAAQEALSTWGYGMSSVRFICGTQQIHKELEGRLSAFLGTEDTILFSSCFDANGGLFETLLDEHCAIISDALNHASIIDGIRLCKAKRWRYQNNDMEDLRRCLEEAKDCPVKLIATDGVFSMDGIIADLKSICDLADTYDALVMVDDSHAVGFVGTHGRGTPEYCGVEGRVDIITGTLGKALGGASGGYVAARQEIVDLLRQRSRPYLFSNTLAPMIAAASIRVIDLLEESTQRRDILAENTALFRKRMESAGFDIIPSTHPIVAIMFYDELLAAKAAELLLEMGIYVTSFTYPVVPKGKARIRVQISCAHSREDLEYVAGCFTKVHEMLGMK
ncbi:MAG: glycine C-acetyltransferase [Oscillospiraceae bacterium]|nr:glycine C-acetyltransferase [Oscillospiraceae bacterium]